MGMSVRSATVKSLLGLLLLALAGSAYLYYLSPSERWLLFWGAKAQAYADVMLEKGAVSKEMSSNFIDVLVVAKPNERTVLFSPHDTHDVAIVYAPSYESEGLVYENATAKRIRKNWYALP
jgi:hypothetical protein